MTDNYSQSVEVQVKSRAKQYLGIVAIFVAVGFLMMAIFLKWYYAFPCAAFLVFGAIYLHVFNKTPKEFYYDFSPVRLVIAKKDVMNKTARILSLLFEDVKSFCVMQGLREENDVVACDSTTLSGVYEIVYAEGDKERRLLFAPDEYLVCLIEEKLKSIKKS